MVTLNAIHKNNFLLQINWLNINVLQQTACLGVNPTTVGNLLSFFIERRGVGLQAHDSSDLKTYLLMKCLAHNAASGDGPTGVELFNFGAIFFF